jgi:glycosyltransferase involved in cell wall biosynthesis
MRDGVHWSSISLVSGNPLRYLHHVHRLAGDLRPDWIGGLSDTWYGILAARLGQQLRTNSLIDAYDNYESYIPWLRPLHLAWRSAINNATLVTAAGPGLARLLEQYRDGKPTMTVPMAADPTGFEPMDRTGCRQQLGLPENRKLVGYCGSIFRNRGIELLFTAINRLKQTRNDLDLVLAGRKGPGITLPADAIWLEHVADDMMPAVFNSLDILAVINKASAFGKFSYPVKLYEAMSCQLPVVASRTPATRWILNDNEDLLVEPDDAGQLCDALQRLLGTARINYGHQPDWYENCEILEQAFDKHDRHREGG